MMGTNDRTTKPPDRTAAGGRVQALVSLTQHATMISTETLWIAEADDMASGSGYSSNAAIGDFCLRNKLVEIVEG